MALLEYERAMMAVLVDAGLVFGAERISDFLRRRVLEKEGSGEPLPTGNVASPVPPSRLFRRNLAVVVVGSAALVIAGIGLGFRPGCS
jgi:hypothetical protein